MRSGVFISESQIFKKLKIIKEKRRKLKETRDLVLKYHREKRNLTFSDFDFL